MIQPIIASIICKVQLGSEEGVYMKRGGCKTPQRDREVTMVILEQKKQDAPIVDSLVEGRSESNITEKHSRNKGI